MDTLDTRKRPMDGDEKDQQKRVKVTDQSLVIRCLVDTKKSGALIGRGGSVINSFREQSGAWVDLSSAVPGATKRILSVKGNLQTCTVAFQMIVNRIAESRQENLERNQQEESTGDTEITLELLIGSSQAGAVIGKGGAVINAIRQETGARVKISSDPLPMSTEKTVNIRGVCAAVTAAVTRVVASLSEVTDRPARQPYIPQPEMQGYGAYYGGLQGMASQGVYGMYGSQQQTPSHHSMQQQQQQQPMIMSANTQTLVLPVPEAAMGGVIGRGGCHINDVRQRSGAQIKIPKSDRSSAERMIQITGTPQANEMAISLIHQKMAAAAQQQR